MIDRYRTPFMKDLFSTQRHFERFLKVELASMEAHADYGIIPSSAVDKAKKHATVDGGRIEILEKTTRHDVVAFIQAVSETLGEEQRYFHYGLTSTDIVDTAHALAYKQANERLEARLKTFIHTLKDKAITYRDTPCIGRTHGIHADITSFGVKMALYVDIFTRQLDHFSRTRQGVETGKISGAVGNHANVAPSIQDKALDILGLHKPAISTQVLQRDRHATYMNTLSTVASCVEQLATEIRHLSRSEVREVEEAFKPGQKGSSAMPHKKNPIASENMCGVARMVRGYASMVNENIALWHERDISHSSVERVAMVDAITLMDYMLERYERIIRELVVYEDRMLRNIHTTHGVIFSQQVMNRLIEHGMSRKEAYERIQPLAIRAYETGEDFRAMVENEGLLPKETLDECFDVHAFLKHTDTLFKRIGI